MKITDYRNYVNDWMYLERYVNIGSDHKYKDQSDVPARYRPGSPSPDFPIYGLQSDYEKTEDLLPDGFYPVHPFTAKLYKKVDATLVKTPYRAVPTSSTRTMLLSKDNFATCHFVKLDLPVKISRFDRSIDKEDVVFSGQIRDEMDHVRLENTSYAFGYLREVGGGHTTLKNGREVGYLARNLMPTWLSRKEVVNPLLVPSFAMISPDPNDKNRLPPILIQILANYKNPQDALFEKILKPLIDYWFLLADKGILWELQQQNALFVLSEQHEPVGIVARDYDGAYIDAEVRKEKNLHINFLKHVMQTPEERTIRYSLTLDHRVCKQNLLRLIDCFGAYYDQAQATKVRQRTTDYIDFVMPDNIKAVFPDNEWYTFPETLFDEGIPITKDSSPPPLRPSH